MVSRSPLDRLTDKERALVRAKLAAPVATMLQLAKIAGFKGKHKYLQTNVLRMLKRPRVQSALANPPPGVDPRIDFIGMPPAEQKKWLLGWYVRLVENTETPQSERIRALGAISEMVPGAKVPVGLHHTGTWNLEQFVAAAGGKPADAPGRSPEEMPN